MTDKTYNFIRKPSNWIIVIMVISILGALIYNFIAATKLNLPEYTGGQDVVKLEPDQREELNLETKEYCNNLLAFSMQVPADWPKIVKNGHDTFVNQIDGAYLAFSVGEYDPYANMVDENDIASDVINAGGVYGGFSKIDNSSYLAIYELGEADYFELTSWDLSSNVRIQMSVPVQRYDYYKEIAIYLFDSFQWQKQNPIPEEYFMFYSQYGNFEFAVPVNWTQAIVDGIYSASSPDTGSILYASVTKTEADLSAISQVAFVEAVSNGKQNFMLSTFNNTGTVLTAEVSYLYGDITHHCIYTMLATGSFQYEFSFECIDEAYQSDGSLFIGSMNLFRCF